MNFLFQGEKSEDESGDLLALIITMGATAVPVLGQELNPNQIISSQPRPVTTDIVRRASILDNQWPNPKALRVVSMVEEGVTATEWAISGELVNYTTVRSRGNAAVSGVSKKHGTGNVFAGHFQSIDYTGGPSRQGGPMVGAEINLKANGDDNEGLRVGLDMPAKTQPFDGILTQRGQYAAAIRVRNPPGDGPAGGIWKTGLHIYDSLGARAKGQPMPVGIAVQTRGESGIHVKGASRAGITVSTTGTDGIKIIGANKGAAIRIRRGAYIALDGRGLIRFRYETDANGLNGRIQFYSGVNRIGYLDTVAGVNRRLN